MFFAYSKELIFIPFLLLTMWASFKDITTYTIPNKISICLIGLFFLYLFFLYPEHKEEFLSFVSNRLLVSLFAFFIGIIIWHLKIMGGGDVKYFASLSLFFASKTVFYMLLMTFIFGGILAVLIILLRRFVENKKSAFKELFDSKNGIPYGVAISISALICFIIECCCKI
jgi:prepilin peptidase CpaA